MNGDADETTAAGSDLESAFSVDSVEDEDQLQPADSLDDRGLEDSLDEGIVTREHWGPGQGFGNTFAEQQRGETLEQRIAQEEPDVLPGIQPEEVVDRATDAGADWEWAEGSSEDEREVGDLRAGRLVAPDEGAHGDSEAQALAYDVGIDGAAASAEEAAMHVIPDEE